MLQHIQAQDGVERTGGDRRIELFDIRVPDLVGSPPGNLCRPVGDLDFPPSIAQARVV